MIDHLSNFMRRMEKLKIKVDLKGNFPWIYINKINGRRVTERFHAKHGFTIAFMPHHQNHDLHLTNIKEIFKLIRKYNDRHQ